MLEEWRALYDMEPWDVERTDFATGTLIMHQYAAHGVQPKEPIKYMRFLKQPKPRAQAEGKMKQSWGHVCDEMAKREKLRMNDNE